MKTLYINESMAKMLKESVLRNALPSDIIQAIKDDETPFGNNRLFRDRNGVPGMTSFLMGAVKSQFESARDTLKKMGQIETVDANSVGEAFLKIVNKCQEIEGANKAELEKMAINYVIDLFKVPDDFVKINAELVAEVNGQEDVAPIEPFDGDVNFELADIDDSAALDSEIYKRQFLNAINMGAGMRMSENIRGYLDDLYDIDDRLPQLYKEALSLNNYMLFSKLDAGISDKNKHQIGMVNIVCGGPDELVVINAQGVIFPVLLCELIRGFMELFASHGLPKDLSRAKYIMSKTDFIKAEPWLMRVGPYMWNLFSEYFEDTDTSDMPYIYQTLAKTNPDFFFKVVSEMFAKTAKGKRYAEKIKEKAAEKKDRFAFNDKMSTYQTKRNVLTDDCKYMSPEEI